MLISSARIRLATLFRKPQKLRDIRQLAGSINLSSYLSRRPRFEVADNLVIGN